MQAAGNPFVHMELNASDPAKAKAFYGEMFGWEFLDNDMGEMGTYSTFKPTEGPGGGMFSTPGGHPGWLAYIGVSDIKASTEKAKELGATIHVGPHQIPHVGWMTILSDPCGCALAIFQPAEGSGQG
jgi:predicted enzyme related to lactoylglutathione lyase